MTVKEKWLKRNDALENPKEDKLFSDYLAFTKNLILSIKPPFVLGVLGEWGRGKTTLFNFLVEDLKDRFKIIRFESLKYERTGNLSLAFVNAILSELSHVKKREVKNFLKEASQVFQVGFNLGFLSIQSNPKEIAKIFKEKYESIINLQKQFKKSLEKEDKEILVFIDDLDRCIPEFALEFLENMRYFFSVDKIIFVIALDEKIIDIALQKRYGSNSRIKPRAYLEKFIDFFIRLPNYEVKNIKEYLHFLIKEKYQLDKIKRGPDSSLWEEIINLAEKIPALSKSSLLTNPRKVDRIIKTLTMLIQTVPESSILLKSYPLLFLMLVLREYYPEIFRILRDNRTGPVHILFWIYCNNKRVKEIKFSNVSTLSKNWKK